MDELAHHIQGLPQELQDEILGHVVQPQVNGVIWVATDYKPPVGLQINRKIRSKTALQFYGTNIFSIGYIRYDWTWSLPTAHLKTIYEFRTLINGYDLSSPPNPSENVMKQDTCGLYREDFVERVKRRGQHPNFEPLRFSVAFRKATSTRWYESLTMIKTGLSTFNFESSQA